MITTDIPTLKIHKLSKEQYERELAAGSLDENALYFTPDEEYYTETEIDSKLDDKSDKDHNHDSRYYTESEIDSKLDLKVPVTRKINGITLNEDITLAPSNIGAAASSHSHDDRYYTETEMDSKLSGKANSSHNHSAANITSGTLSADRLPSIPVGKLEGVIDSSNLPSYVDDVLEYTAKANFPTAGETGKIYVDTTTNLTYRWSGSAYVEISPSLALGENSSTAYRGDRGKTAYDHSQATGNPHGTTIADISNLQNTLDSKVPSSRTINGKALSANVSLTASDVGASASNHTHNYAGSSSAGGSANTVANGGAATESAARHVWFSDSGTETKRVSDDNFKYNPVGNLLTANISGNAATATKATNADNATSADSATKATSLAPVTTAGDGAAYTATVNGITALTVGANFIMNPHVLSTSTTPTLNVNGLGAKTIRVQLSNSSSTAVAPAQANFLGPNKPVEVVYNGSFWVVQLIRPDASTIYGTVSVAKGGTGKSSITAGSYLVGNGTNAITEKTAAQLYADIQSYVQAEINSAIGAALSASY